MSANVTRTLALIKPDLYAHHRHALPALRRRITAVEGFSIARERVVRWSPAEAGRFYAEHRERFFYARLVGYMSAGPFLAMELERDDGKDAVMHWRQLIGATSPYG